MNKDAFDVQSMRMVFFLMLKDFLVPAYLSIRDKPDENMTSLNDYFDAEEYLYQIADFDDLHKETYVNFAEHLIESNSFSHFMDGYIHDDIMNFDLVNSILCQN